MIDGLYEYNGRRTLGVFHKKNSFEAIMLSEVEGVSDSWIMRLRDHRFGSCSSIDFQ